MLQVDSPRETGFEGLPSQRSTAMGFVMEFRGSGVQWPSDRASLIGAYIRVAFVANLFSPGRCEPIRHEATLPEGCNLCFGTKICAPPSLRPVPAIEQTVVPRTVYVRLSASEQQLFSLLVLRYDFYAHSSLASEANSSETRTQANALHVPQQYGVFSINATVVAKGKAALHMIAMVSSTPTLRSPAIAIRRRSTPSRICPS